MAWTGLNLTVEGRAALNKAQTDKHLNFKSIVVGDGNPPGNFSTVNRLVHQLYELTDLKIDTTDAGCMLTADLPDVDYDYYMREIGVIVTTDDGEKLYVYDNCGSDAQCIVSTTGAEKTQKRIRLSLLVSDVKNITVSQPSILYVAYDDFENAVNELEQKKVDISGGDISDTVATLDETAGDATDNIASGESLRTILSKMHKVIRQFFIHKSDTVIHTTKADKDKLAGIEEHANNYVHPDTHPAGMITSDANHRFVTDDKIEAWDNSLSASKTYTDGMYRQATAYADKKVADLIGGAPESLDTLKEVADAIKENESVMDALDAAVGKKANQSELDTHVDNSTIHITSQEREKWNGSVSKTGDASNTTVTFTESTRVKPTSGEKLSTIVGKIVKWLADLKTVAFSGSYNDLNNIPSTFNPAAHNHYSFMTSGTNIVNSASDNTETWRGKNSCISFFTPNTLDGQPSDYGLIFNMVNGGEVHQIWATQSGGSLFHRGGNANGWGSGWKEIIDCLNISSQSVDYANSAGSIAWSGVSGKPSTYPPATHSHNYIVGQYTGSGGRVPPSYVGANAVKCNMMNGFEGLNTPNLDGYMDVLMMNAYFWNDVPYATALGIKKGNGGVRAWIANGGNTSSWSQVAELLTSANYTEYAADKSHTHSDYLTIKGAQDINNRIAASENYIADIRDRLSSGRLKMTWDDAHLCHYIDGSFIGYMMKTYSSDTFYPVYEVLTFKDSNNVLFSGDKGNYIVGISAYSDARLKENIKSSKVNALESLNEIEMCSFDFIDRKYGAHSELGYIAQQLQKVIPECVVAVPQDKEQMGYDELLQVQDTHLIPYLVKAIQELSSKVAELEKKIVK